MTKVKGLFKVVHDIARSQRLLTEWQRQELGRTSRHLDNSLTSRMAASDREDPEQGESGNDSKATVWT